MKRSFHSFPFIRYIVVFLLLVIIIIVEQKEWVQPVRGLAERIVVPVVSGFYAFPPGLRKDSEFALTQTSIATMTATISRLEMENNALRKQLQLSEDIRLPKVMAQPMVIDRHMVINKGRDDGIAIHDFVIAQNVLIGQVITVTPHTATIRLTSDPDSAIPVWTPQLTRGIAKGAYGQTMILDGVAQSDYLEPGNIVSTTGEEGFTQNLVVGKVESIQSEPRDVYKKAVLTPLIDIHKITTVFVIASVK